MSLKSTLISVKIKTIFKQSYDQVDKEKVGKIVISCVLSFTDHQYSTAEFIPETFSYTGSSGPLDLTRYFIYMGAIIIFIYVSLKILKYPSDTDLPLENIITINPFLLPQSKIIYSWY